MHKEDKVSEECIMFIKIKIKNSFLKELNKWNNLYFMQIIIKVQEIMIIIIITLIKIFLKIQERNQWFMIQIK
jgi:hypothetical protein